MHKMRLKELLIFAKENGLKLQHKKLLFFLVRVIGLKPSILYPTYINNIAHMFSFCYKTETYYLTQIFDSFPE